jgi:HSP20 family protein
MEELAMTLVKRTNMFLPTFWDNFFSKDLSDWGMSNFSSTDTTLPAVNVKESDEAFEIEVAAPGMSKDDFKVSLENNILTISSEKEEERKQEEKGRYTRREFSYQSFQRSFTLPELMVEGDKISAKYSEGVLSIHLPKKEEVKPKPAREISIS